MTRHTRLTLAIVATLVAGSLAIGGTAAALQSTSGAGTGTSLTGSVDPIALAPGTAGANLYPGATTAVTTVATNPNPGPVRIVRLELDTTQGTGGYLIRNSSGVTVAGCASTSFTFTPQTTGWNLAGNTAVTISLPGALAMATSAASACQGVTITVYLRATT